MGEPAKLGSINSITSQIIPNSHLAHKTKMVNKHFNSISGETLFPDKEFLAGPTLISICRVSQIWITSSLIYPIWWPIWTHKIFKWTSMEILSMEAFHMVFNNNSNKDISMQMASLMVMKAVSILTTLPLISLSNSKKKKRKNSSLLMRDVLS